MPFHPPSLDISGGSEYIARLPMGCGASVGAAPLFPPPGSAEGADRQERTGTDRDVPGDAGAATPIAPDAIKPTLAAAPHNAAAPPPKSPSAAKGDAGPNWSRDVAAREQRQAAWAEDEKPHWEAARKAALDDADRRGGAISVLVAAAPEPDEMAALMCGRLALLVLQRLNRPPGLAVFCSSTVRSRLSVGGSPSIGTPLVLWSAHFGSLPPPPPTSHSAVWCALVTTALGGC